MGEPSRFPNTCDSHCTDYCTGTLPFISPELSLTLLDIISLLHLFLYDSPLLYISALFYLSLELFLPLLIESNAVLHSFALVSKEETHRQN